MAHKGNGVTLPFDLRLSLVAGIAAFRRYVFLPCYTSKVGYGLIIVAFQLEGINSDQELRSVISSPLQSKN